MTNDKIKDILDTLNALQEDLLSLPDDMLLGIDPRDNESLKAGTQFLTAFNESVSQFAEIASSIETSIKQHFGINPEEDELEQETVDRQGRERIVKELDKTARHSLKENFTYKRPFGFILEDAAYKGIKTWKNLYLHVLKILREKDPEKFDHLPEEERFISNRGNPLFAREKTKLRIEEKLGPAFYAEINLSANNIRDNINTLLSYFQIDPHNMQVFLREDRDANRQETMRASRDAYHDSSGKLLMYDSSVKPVQQLAERAN
jgi:hypothetical protein